MSDMMVSCVNYMHLSEMDYINDIPMMTSISKGLKNENNTVRLVANHFTKTLQCTDPNVYLGSTPITSN